MQSKMYINSSRIFRIVALNIVSHDHMRIFLKSKINYEMMEVSKYFIGFYL